MAASKQLCCMHPQQRIDSPEPPPRPLASIDGIFAAAALPDDHPHALQFKNMMEKKPELDATIIRSPGLTDKLKMQWRKKSVKNLSKEKEYDDDAKRITSREVMDAMPASDRSRSTSSSGLGLEHGQLDYAASLELERSRYVSSQSGSKGEVRSSVLGSAEYLRPLFEKPSMIAVSGESYNIVDVATRVANQRTISDISQTKERPLPPLPKSLSSPLLLPWTASIISIPARRTRSEICLDDTLKIPKQRAAMRSEPEVLTRPIQQLVELGASRPVDLPSLHVQEATVTELPSLSQNKAKLALSRADSATPVQERHLSTMGISQQLRTMSQLSDPVEDDVSTISTNPWNFHHRERSGVGFESSARTRHSRVKSSTGVDSATVPSAWGRVRSPTAASSIYSRPTSAGVNAEDAETDQNETPSRKRAMDMNALFADWPLRPSASSDDSASKSNGQQKPLPAVPADGRELFVTKADRENPAVKWLSPPRESSAAPRTSSSSVISSSSKTSRFLERFSPPKKSVRKRRSMFKFLRPGSRKQQARSVSTPIMSTKSPSGAAFDGPTDDPALLIVQYELAERPQHTTRSASMNQLGPMRQSTSIGAFSTPQPLQRQPTLADYERNLSVVGDDRRRPSSMNLTRLNEIQEEDRRESFGIRRKLSRARELKDDVSPLMAQALTKHQQEKDAFRSSSKRRSAASIATDRPTPVFAQSSFGAAGSSLTPTPEDQSELLDPLEKPATDAAQRQHSSANYLSPLDAAGASRRGSAVTGPSTPGTASSFSAARSSRSAAPRQPKIGTSLASWSRYPSHTRFERAGSAGKVDNVITRDFAFNFDPAGVHASDDESDAGAPDRSPNTTPKKPGKKLAKSRSLTFGSIVRYYSNLFHTSGWAGQNRRTSVTVGGRLEHPELEMLPPVVIMEPAHGHETIKHLKDIVKEDVDKVRDFVAEEESRIEGFVKKEEGRIESFLREEEDKIEKFVEEEEDKLEGFVKREEGKLRRFVHGEEEKWKQLATTPGTSFRHRSIFSDHPHAHPERRETTVEPNAYDEDQAPGEKPKALHLDGASPSTTHPPTDRHPGLPKPEPSKAQLWSTLYQEECLPARAPTRPGSAVATREPARSESLPPPSGGVVQTKPRIRRFPSVTVIDDRKGHWRSVSMISSVGTGRS